MIERLGIIPAAGRAHRFGGTLKEMLPIHEDVALIDCAYNALKMCGNILVVTSLPKLPIHAARLPGATFRLQQCAMDLWGAMVESLPISGRRNLLAMPDTYFNQDAFDRELPADLTLGVFNTNLPERFGMLRGECIVDKQPGCAGKAWGVLAWSDKVAEYWWDHLKEIDTCTQALNMAIRKFGFATFDLLYFYDCANMAAYQEMLAHV